MRHKQWDVDASCKAVIEEIAAGRTIFKQGDTDKKTIYLVDGEITMTSKSGEVISVTTGTDAAKHPLANFQPRKHTAVAKSACKITRIDSDLLDILMTWDQMSSAASRSMIHWMFSLCMVLAGC